MTEKPPGPVVGVRLVVDNADEIPAPSSSATAAPPDAPRGARDDDLPPDCPVIPLGILGDMYYFLDQRKQLRDVRDRDMSRLKILSLFGGEEHKLFAAWPRYNAERVVTGWKPERAQEALMSAAARRGLWDPSERERGCGSWLGDTGNLVLHCGDVIIDGGVRHEPGLIGRYVYPSGTRAPRPWPAMVPAKKGPGDTLLSILRSWNWKRGDLDAQLVLGWICAAMIGGAIDWRPLIWLTGSKSTGKSTLHKLLQRLFDGALVSVSDASAAGIWQKLRHATVPVAIDELESEEDNRKTQAIVKLARQAASGGVVLRGGADHVGSEFVARSCFLFSSILIPPLLGQDRSRMAICELKPLKGEAAPDISPARCRELGQQILRRLVDRWPVWNDTVTTYREALMQVGHGNRGADVFGTLLAAAELALSDAAPNRDYAAELAEKLQTVSLAETEDDLSGQERCLQYLMSSVIPLDTGNAKHAVGEWIRRAAGSDAHDPDVQHADEVLARHGLRVLRQFDGHGEPCGLAIANTHAQLARIFAGTHWAARSGAPGVWQQDLLRLPMADRSPKTIWFCGSSSRAIVIPLELVISAADRAFAKVKDKV